MDQTPFRVGLQAGTSEFPEERTRVHQARFSQATRLGDLTDQYAFFTPALLYLYVDLRDRDPLLLFREETGLAADQFSIQFNKPIFSGMEYGPDASWNSVLFAMEHESFKQYKHWLGQFTFVNRDRGLIHRVNTQDVELIDPLFLESAVVLPSQGFPRIPATVFILDSNRGCCWVDRLQGPSPLYKVALSLQVSKRTAAFAEAIFGEMADPYGYVARKEHPDQGAALEEELRRRYAEQEQEALQRKADGEK